MPQKAPTHVQEVFGRKAWDASYRQQGKHEAGVRVYTSKRWARLRKMVLARQPFCADPYGWHASEGQVVLSRQVDHIVPLRVQPELAYVLSNLQGLCHRCHGWKTRHGG